jgi:hypothetical protein
VLLINPTLANNGRTTEGVQQRKPHFPFLDKEKSLPYYSATLS